jgi:aspartate racemase
VSRPPSDALPTDSPAALASRLDAVQGAPPPDETAAIGVLGGLGPYAGLDLVRAIFDETDAHADQEHLPVALLSYPGRIPDRSTWIADPDAAPSPLPAMIGILRRLDAAGCAVAGIPCNTAHAPVLFDALKGGLAAEGRALRLLHIVDAIVEHLAEVAPGARTIGILATDSSLANRLHERGLKAAGMRGLRPDARRQARVQASIFDPHWGLKAQSAPPHPEARAVLLDAADALIAAGAEVVILGCTELPLAVPEGDRGGVPFVNSTRALARALIRATHPEALRPVERRAPVEA